MAFLTAYPALAADWAQSFGGTKVGGTTVNATTVDGAGNSYVVGTLESRSITIGSITLTKITVYPTDAFIAKYDATGTVVWAKNFGGANTQTIGSAVAVDASGNVYLTGTFQNGSLSTPALPFHGLTDAFAIKLDSSGNTTWAKSFGGFGGQQLNGSRMNASALAVGANANVYLAGDFDGGASTPAMTQIGTIDAFAFKLDASGNTTWAKNYGGIGSNAYAKGIAVDANSDVYLVGNFDGANLSSPALAKLGTRDAFAMKMDASGTTTWAKHYAGSAAAVTGSGIAVDASGNVYLGGSFNGGDLSSPALVKIGTQDAFAIKLDATGNATWAKNFGGNLASVTGSGIAVDASGNALLAGNFGGADL
ncbi:MAG: SBBP repeat-containing protein, partial [Betaproteobacteria bacterium]